MTELRPSARVAPIVCERCGNSAPFIRCIPNSENRPYEYRMYECSGCGLRALQTIAITEETDAEIEALAERMTGLSR